MGTGRRREDLESDLKRGLGMVLVRVGLVKHGYKRSLLLAVGEGAVVGEAVERGELLVEFAAVRDAALAKAMLEGKEEGHSLHGSDTEREAESDRESGNESESVDESRDETESGDDTQSRDETESGVDTQSRDDTESGDETEGREDTQSRDGTQIYTTSDANSRYQRSRRTTPTSSPRHRAPRQGARRGLPGFEGVAVTWLADPCDRPSKDGRVDGCPCGDCQVDE